MSADKIVTLHAHSTFGADCCGCINIIYDDDGLYAVCNECGLKHDLADHLMPREHATKHASFADSARPLIQWLNENCHPHTSIIITNTSVELVEGVMAHVTEEFIKD